MTSLVRDQIRRFKIVDQRFLQSYLLPPNLRSLVWDYSVELVTLSAWLIADLRQKDISIFYSEHGHGMHDPWGAIHISENGFGMDDGWFLSLADAVINSGCWHGVLPENYEIQ